MTAATEVAKGIGATLLNADGMPTGAGWTLRALAVAGMAVRFINQKKPADE